MAIITRSGTETNKKAPCIEHLCEGTLIMKDGRRMPVLIDEMCTECYFGEQKTWFKGHVQTIEEFRDKYCFTDAPMTNKAVIHRPYEIKNVIFNDPATVVFWQDGTKTVVKCQDGDEFDPEKGLAMAITKKVYGNQGNYCNQLKKWLPKEEKPTLKLDPFILSEPKEFNFTFACDNLAKGLLNELTGAIEKITLTGVKVDTGDEKPAPKKRMTFREEVAKLEPERISATSLGGVQGCPRDQNNFDPCPIDGPRMTMDERCRECWDREIPEELVNDEV